MKRTGTFVGLLFILFPLHSQILLQINKDSTYIWYYSEGDEFNTDKINNSYWRYDLGWARSIYPNKEQQYYSDGENHRLHNGTLSLFAEKKTVNKKMVDWMNATDSIRGGNSNYGINQRDFSYTSGMLQSQKDFTYGYFEIKFKMPAKAGFWPAFWLYGCTPNEEIDMMELKTEFRDKVHIGRFSQNPKENFTNQKLFKRAWGEWAKIKGDLSSGYHIVSGEWTKDHLKFYLNGELLAYSPISMNCPKKLVANIAVPANDGPFKPGPPDSILNSGDFVIDYIRVWSQKDTTTNRSSVFANSDTTEHIQPTRMKNTGRATYGPKKLHKKEGLTLSIVPAQKGYELCVLGKDIPESTIEIVDNKGNTVTSLELKYGISLIDLPKENKYILRFNLYNRLQGLVLHQGRISQE